MKILPALLFSILSPAFAGNFASDLKPLLEHHCYDCHRDGTIGSNYSNVTLDH